MSGGMVWGRSICGMAERLRAVGCGCGRGCARDGREISGDVLPMLGVAALLPRRRWNFEGELRRLVAAPGVEMCG